MAKRALGTESTGSAKHCRSGLDPKWKADFPWIEESDCGLLCQPCRKQNRCPKKVPVGKAPWVDLPCMTMTRQSLVRHSQSECHVTAMKIEADLVSSKTFGGIERAFDQVVSAERRAFIGVLKCMYFLSKKEIPHTTNFLPLVELASL